MVDVQFYNKSGSDGHFVPLWVPATAYALNQVVQVPDGTNCQRNTAGTSRATFDATEKALWTPVSATAGTMDQVALNAAYVTHLGPGTADDTTRLNAVLNAVRLAGGGVVRGLAGATYSISNRLVVGSNTTLDLSPCSLVLLPGSNSNMITTYAKANPVASATDGAVTAGSDTVTTSLAATAQVGQTLLVTGAGYSTAGGSVSAPITVPAVLTGVISAVNVGAGTIQLRKLSGEPLYAGITVSGAAVKLIQRDHDIRILIGYLDRGANGGTTVFDTNSLFLRHVDRLTVDLRGASSTAGKYTVALGDVSDYWVSAKNLNVYSDGVHLTACYGGEVDLVEGHAGEDLLSVTCNDYTANGDISGDVDTLTIGSIRARRQSVGQSLLLAAQAGGYIGNIKVTGQIEGVATSRVHVGGFSIPDQGTYGDIDLGTIIRRRNSDAVTGGYLFLGSGQFNGKIKAKIINDGPAATMGAAPVVGTYFDANGTPGTYKNVEIELVNGSAAASGIQLSNAGMTFEQFTVAGSTTQGAGSYLQVNGSIVNKLVLDKPNISVPGTIRPIQISSQVDHLTLKSARVFMVASGSPMTTVYLTGSAAVETITFEDCRWKCADTTGGYPLGVAAGSLGSVTFRGGLYDAMRAMVTSLASGTAGAFTVVFDGGVVVGGSRLCDFQAAGAMAVELGSVILTSMAAQPINLSTATVTITGKAPLGTIPATFVSRAGSETIRINAPGVKADVSTLTPSNNDRCLNTTATGPAQNECIYNNSVSPAIWTPLNGYVKEGTGTLASGAVTIANGNITANSIIDTTRTGVSGGSGHLYVSARTVSTSFTVTSTDGTDAGTFRYRIRTY